MLRQGNGAANIAASKQAMDAGAKKMVYVSVSDIVPKALGNVGPFPAYFQGIHMHIHTYVHACMHTCTHM